MSDLIRPLHTRVVEAKMTLSAQPLAPQRLAFEAATCDVTPPDVSFDVREQVIREALADAVAWHVPDGERCDDLRVAPGERAFAVLAAGRIVCMRCGIDAEWIESECCELCASAAELARTVTKIDPVLTIVADVCPTCSAWWPRERGPGEASVNYVRTGPPVRREP